MDPCEVCSTFYYRPAGTENHRSHKNGYSSLDPVAGSPITERGHTNASQNTISPHALTAMASRHDESLRKDPITAETSQQNLLPIVTVKSTNASQVGLYEKFEIIVAIDQAVYDNPYDYEQLNLMARFTAPSGRVWEVPGFYDNYQNRNQWKIRFAPNELGQWQYIVKATDRNGTGESDVQFFTAIPSSHHGWLHVAPDHPHYLIFDDGTPFYGVAAYYPWRVNNSATGLGLLASSGCNLFGFWNVTYDDGTLIESLNSGLGRYDQNKCNRIDTILEWAEQRNMVMMLAIWPHDLFCKDMPGWAALWNQNPYKSICTVEEIYENETAWRYQQRQYRYIIARWGYSRALGIWEIINEISGTDAWAKGRIPQAEEWTRKVHAFLKSHDPFDRPTTASMHGGHYWYNGYAAVDLPNVHMYETGWPAKFNSNPMRSSYYTYHTVSRQMWNDFAKPAIMGEAGWEDNYGKYKGGTDEYAMMYHNALWAGWASGLCCTPVWWAFDPRVMETKVLTRMKKFAQLAPTIDYAHLDLRPINAQLDGGDAFAMAADTIAFGWMREASGGEVSGKRLQITGLRDTVYSIHWYDPWEGAWIAIHHRPCIDGELNVEAPLVKNKIPDLAFVIRPIQVGDQPQRLELEVSPKVLFGDGKSTASIFCYLMDAEGRICRNHPTLLTLHCTGPGRILSPTPLTIENGFAMATLQSDSSTAGMVQIIATAHGLIGDTAYVEVTQTQWLDDFEGYGLLHPVTNIWKARTGTTANLQLIDHPLLPEKHVLRVDYALGQPHAPYAGFFREITEPLRPCRFFHFWLFPDGSNRDLVILFNEIGGRYGSWQMPLSTKTPQWVSVDLSTIQPNEGSTRLDVTKLRSISFNILKGSGENGNGTLYIDDLFFDNQKETTVATDEKKEQLQRFVLYNNFPNPFNAQTEFMYELPHQTKVRLSIYQITGQHVMDLVDGDQSAGIHSFQWNAAGLASGVYLAMLQADHQRLTKKVVLLK